jgi:hypothetical protein
VMRWVGANNTIIIIIIKHPRSWAIHWPVPASSSKSLSIGRPLFFPAVCNF